MTLESMGLWLAALGALVLVAERIAFPPEQSLGLRFPSGETSGRQRLDFVAEGIGLLLIATGSALLAIASLPGWTVVVATIGGAAFIAWILSAWQLRNYWRVRLQEALELLHGDFENPLAWWHVDCAAHCATVRWALTHPLSREHWPASCYMAVGEPPSGSPTSREAVNVSPRRDNETASTLVRDVHVPNGFTEVAAGAYLEGFDIRSTPQHVVLFEPGGFRAALISRRIAESLLAGLERRRVSKRLRQLGLDAGQYNT